MVIRKDNKIIQKTINKFNHKQNQLMCVLLGKYIDLNSNECINTTISINELRKALGLTRGTDNYKTIKKAIERFGEVGSVGTLEINSKGNSKYVWRPYFKKIELDENECIFSWNDEMKPYLLELKNNYTQYLASDYLKLKSTHSQNLYEQMKSLENYENTYHKKPQIEVDELRSILGVGTKYKTFNSFNSICLKRATDDINNHTDITVAIKPIKKGRCVVACQFEIRKKVSENTKNTFDIEEKEIDEASNSVVNEELSTLLVQLHNGEL